MNFKYQYIILSLLILCTLFNSLNTISAVDVYQDAKFQFTFSQNHEDYSATVTRRDHDFDKYPLVFIFNLIVRKDGDYHPLTVTQTIFLDRNQENNTLKWNWKGYKFCTIKKDSYGVKFPQYREMNGDLPDAAFNLQLKYRDAWFKTEDPYIMYKLYRRDGKPTNCNVNLKHAILSYYRDGTQKKTWENFHIEAGKQSNTGIILKDSYLYGFSLSATDIIDKDEYYLQFQK